MAAMIEEIIKQVELAKPHLRKHTGTIAHRPKEARDPADDFGCASCVYIEYCGQRFAITCEHVTRGAGTVYDLAIAPSDKPTPFGPVTNRFPVTVLKEDKENDLAVLDVQLVDFSVAQRLPFVLETSDFITKACLDDQPGLLSFIWGALGSKVTLTPMREHVYFEVPIYSAFGYMKTVSPNEITAEFREEELLVHNIEAFPQLKDMRISGGSRDLSGMSGSGLWVADKHGIILAGILTGPVSGEKGDPEIRFTPVWVLRAILEKAAVQI